MKKLIRITTIPLALEKLLENQLRFMKDFYIVTAISSDKERLEVFGDNQGVNTFHIELTRKITIIKDLKATYKLYKFLKKEKPQIVHTHTPKAGIVGMLASYLANIPVRLHTVAGLPLLEAKGFKRIILNIVEKLTYMCATKVYPNSFKLKDIIIKNRFTKEYKLKVIANGSSNGINASFFNPDLFNEENKQALKNKLKIKKDDFVFIYVGRIVGDKGINELATAFDNLSNDNKKVKLLLVGPLEQELDPLQDETIRIINYNKQIISLSYQNDVRPFFAIANVLVFPSYREGFPNVVLQAGAMGLPSLVSDINGCNEIIKNNKNGIIVPPKNVDALFKAMKNILEDKNLIFHLKNNAREIIISKYEQEYVWSEILNEYKILSSDV